MPVSIFFSFIFHDPLPVGPMSCFVPLGTLSLNLPALRRTDEEQQKKDEKRKGDALFWLHFSDLLVLRFASLLNNPTTTTPLNPGQEKRSPREQRRLAPNKTWSLL
jgi:hypothetical protein